MKNYRVLVPIVMVVLMGLSWYMMIDEAVEATNVYDGYVQEARKYAEEGITKYAIENYRLALAEESSPELYREVAEYYKEKGTKSAYIDWCEEFYEVYPTDVSAYECLVEAYISDKDYDDCFDVLETAEKRNITSEALEQMKLEIKYIYEIEFSSFDEIGVYGYGLCPVKTKDSWGYVDRFGTLWIGYKFNEVGPFSSEKVAPVVGRDGEAYFIDDNGVKEKVSKETYKSFGLMAANRCVAICEDGTYCYLDGDLTKVCGNYDFATTINLSRAAVKNGDAWTIINENGEAVSSEVFIDVKYDEKMICYRNGRMFAAKEAGKYMMLDETGKQVGKLVFEDAKVFLGDMPAAVKIGGKWCFVNAEGERISDKTYEDARSFSNGLAAVKINGKWGFVDLEENVVIEPQFVDASDFNNRGSCFIKKDTKWQLLKLYRLNR